jgi:hypothetical protein
MLPVQNVAHQLPMARKPQSPTQSWNYHAIFCQAPPAQTQMQQMLLLLSLLLLLLPPCLLPLLRLLPRKHCVGMNSKLHRDQTRR